MPTDREDDFEQEEYPGEHQRESVLLWRDYRADHSGAEELDDGDKRDMTVALPMPVASTHAARTGSLNVRAGAPREPVAQAIGVAVSEEKKEAALVADESGAEPARGFGTRESPTAMMERIQRRASSSHRRMATLTGGPLSQPVPATAALIRALTVLLPHMSSDQFFILANETDGDCYAQTAVTEDGFVIEFHRGNDGAHYTSVRVDIPAEEVATRFLQYLACDIEWREGLAMSVLDHTMNLCEHAIVPSPSLDDFGRLSE